MKIHVSWRLWSSSDDYAWVAIDPDTLGSFQGRGKVGGGLSVDELAWLAAERAVFRQFGQIATVRRYNTHVTSDVLKRAKEILDEIVLGKKRLSRKQARTKAQSRIVVDDPGDPVEYLKLLWPDAPAFVHPQALESYSAAWMRKARIIVERDGNACCWCGGLLRIAPKTLVTGKMEQRELATLEHLVPRWKGGGNDVGNLKLACAECNHARGDREGPPPEAYLLSKRRQAEKRAAKEALEEKGPSELRQGLEEQHPAGDPTND